MVSPALQLATDHNMCMQTWMTARRPTLRLQVYNALDQQHGLYSTHVLQMPHEHCQLDVKQVHTANGVKC